MSDIETRDESNAVQAAYIAWCDQVTTDDVPEREVWRAAWLAGRDWARNQEMLAQIEEQRQRAIQGEPEVETSAYDLSRPFDADRLMSGFTEERSEHAVHPESPLGKAMASAREAWAAPGYVPIDPDTFTVTPHPVDIDDRED